MMNLRMKSFPASVAAIVIALLPLGGVVGCAAHFEEVDGYDATYVESPPPNIEVYPRYEVADGYAYEVNGRYYHRHGDRWVVYRSAPREVYRQRGYVQQAPPARPGWR
jgi:hypothetical protein